MTATVIQIRDFQNKRDIQRLYEEVTAELLAIEGATEISNVAIIPHDAAIAEEYVAPETDPA